MSNSQEMNTKRTAVNPALIYTQSMLARTMASLQGHRIIALDTESDSLFSYYPKVCLIQLSAYADPEHPDPTAVVDYLLDPLRLEHLDDLGKLLADPDVEVIIHAAENDIYILQRDFGFIFNHIFDTQLAARILGWKQVGLAKILEREFGLVSNKRMQRTNWGKRPLTPQQIAYAQMDTHYLPALREIQIERLREMDRWEEAQEAFSMLTRLDYYARPNNGRTFWSMKAARSVPKEDLNVLSALWTWREEEAKHQDRPPFKIMRDEALVRIAAERPLDPGALARIAGLSDYQLRRYGKAVIAAVQQGQNDPQPTPPKYVPRPEQLADRPTLARYDALRRWRSRAARERGVNTDIVFNNATLLEIAQRQPHSLEDLQKIPEIGPWKAKTYGADILSLVKG
jgi:ribonuclease D